MSKAADAPALFQVWIAKLELKLLFFLLRPFLIAVLQHDFKGMRIA